MNHDTPMIKDKTFELFEFLKEKKKLLSEPKEKRTASQTVAPCLSSINWIYYIGSAKLNINSK